MNSKKNSLLWQLEAPQNTAPSFLFGTMHLRNISSFPAWERACAALESCDLYAAEIDLDAEMGLHVRTPPAQPENYSLRETMGNLRYERMRGIWHRALKLDLNSLNHLPPSVLHTLFTGVVLGDQNQDMPDHKLWELAGHWGKERDGLEAIESQMRLLQSIPSEYYLKSMLQASSQLTRFRKKMQRLNYLYETEQIQKLYQVTRLDLGGMRGAMLFSRNRIMAHRIELLSDQKPLLAAVGAAHLGGDKGLLTLLKRRGFKVKPA
jgi:uncharacterized protein YbaP (TraB family)